VGGAPYSLRWPLGRVGEHTAFARATDTAGNTGETERVTFQIRP
jgi:hypothetical protein